MSIPRWLYIAIMLILCIITIVINLWFDEYKALGAGCLFLMTFLAIIGNKSDKEK